MFEYTRDDAHTMSKCSQSSRRNPSCTRASRDEAGLPRPRHRTLGEVKETEFRESRRISTTVPLLRNIKNGLVKDRRWHCVIQPRSWPSSVATRCIKTDKGGRSWRNLFFRFLREVGMKSVYGKEVGSLKVDAESEGIILVVAA